MGSLTSSFIPAGRLGTDPLSPRASSCRIGPRRQGFASPLRALDGCGPIRKTRCSRGERGGSGRGARGRVASPLAHDKGERGGSGRGARGRVASPLAHDKGYYHSCFGAKPKGTFRPYQPSEPQARGAVTRRAVAQRGSRAGGLTRLSAEAIRGFDSGFGCRFACPFRCGIV